MNLTVVDLGIFSILKGVYYKAEDKWYDFLDALDRRQIPVYKIIDPIDKIMPSFLLFILLVLFLLILSAYLMQFYSPAEFTFTAVDSKSKEALLGVVISGSINEGAEFSKVTDKSGIAKVTVQGEPVNLFGKIGQLFFYSEEEFSGVISAEKSGYTKIDSKKYTFDSKDVTITLSPVSTQASSNKISFASSVDVELIDNATSERIVDSKGTAFVKYSCANKGIDVKTSSDGFDGSVDGSFRLIEPNCDFVIKGAYSSGYERIDSANIELDSTQATHQIRLTKLSSPTKGIARIQVFELNSSPETPLVNIQVRLLDMSGNSMEDGSTDFSGVMQKEVSAGSYLITATSPDGNFFSLNSDSNQVIVINASETTSKTIYLKRMDPALVRFLKIKVIDYNGRTPIKDVLVFPQQLISNDDKNRDAKGIIGLCTNSCKTDSNGLVTISGLSSIDEGKVVVSLYKEGYIAKAFEPTFFKVASSEYETVEMEKIDYSETGNSGKGLIWVRAQTDLRGLVTTAYMYFNSPELNINGINLLQSGIRTDSNGKALFEGLANRNDKVYYAKASYDGVEGASKIKAVGAGETVLFDVNINTEISYLEVNLLGYADIEVADKNKAVVKISSLDSTSATPEILTFNSSTKTFKSKMHDKGREYQVTIDLNNYVPVKKSITLSLAGKNIFNQVMYPDNNEILAVFHGLYESASSQNPADFLDLNNSLDGSSKGYYSKMSLIVGKPLKDGNVLGAFKINDKMNITAASVTQDYLKDVQIYSCAPDQKQPYNDDNYYIQSTSCIASPTTQGKQLGVIWEGSVPSGVYDITSRMEFLTSTKNGDSLDINYSGKQNDYNYVSEDKNNSVFKIGLPMCRVSSSNSSCAGIFFHSSLNNESLGTELFTFDSEKKRFSKYNFQPEVEKDVSTPWSIAIFNNHSTPIDFNLTVYAYSSSMDSFAKNTSGFFHFDSADGVQKKMIGENVHVAAFSDSNNLDVNVFTSTEKSKSYLIAVATLSNGEEYILFIDTASKGRSLILIGGTFLSGVPDQIFHASVVNLDKQPVNLARAEWKVLKNCSEENVLFSGSADILEDSKDAFTMTIPGVYDYGLDCLSLRLVAQDAVYNEFNTKLVADTWGIEDPELSCATIGVVALPGNYDAYHLKWGNTTNMIITNNCAEKISLLFESRLMISGTGSCANIDPAELYPNEKCTIQIKAQNKDYNENEKFSDILGVFPLYVKSKYSASKKNYSQVKLIKFHVQNDGQCFSLSKDSFDIKNEPEATQFFINNACQNTDFNDYFIPKATLALSGVDLNDNKQKYGKIDFNYNINVSGGAYELATKQVLRERIKLNFPEFASDHTATAQGNLTRYENFTATISQKLNADSDHMMFRWTDSTDNEMYGAKIDGPVTVTYYDGSTQTVTPSANFDFSSGKIACIGTGECIIGDDIIAGGDNDNTKYGLFYVNYPKGKVKSISYNVLGDPNAENLLIYTDVFVDYNESQTVPVPSGEITTNTIASGSFSIYPIEGVTFLLRNYTNPQVTDAIKEKVNLCKAVLTKRAWIGSNNKIYWVVKHYNNYSGAVNDCNSISGRLLGNNTNTLAESYASIPQNVTADWAENPDDFNWLDTEKGLWTNECTDANCKVIVKTDNGVSGGPYEDKYFVDKYAPLCEQSNPDGITIDEDLCKGLGVVCDATTKVCSESTPELFDSFLADGYIELTDPSTSIEITNATTNDITLDKSAVLVWIEGGILKAMFLGSNYTGYDDKTIELNLVNKDVVGDLYGTLTVVDYIQSGNLS